MKKYIFAAPILVLALTISHLAQGQVRYMVDTTFFNTTTLPTDTLASIFYQPDDGKTMIVLPRRFQPNRTEIFRMNPSGSPDNSFGIPPTPPPSTILRYGFLNNIQKISNNYFLSSSRNVHKLPLGGSAIGQSPLTRATPGLFHVLPNHRLLVLAGDTILGSNQDFFYVKDLNFNTLRKFNIPDINFQRTLIHNFTVSGNRIYAYGDFNSVGSHQTTKICRMDTLGNLDTTFSCQTLGTNAFSLEINVFEETYGNKLLVGGRFLLLYNGRFQTCNLARFNTNGSLDTSFKPLIDLNPSRFQRVSKVLPIGANDLLVAGNFINYNGTPRGRIARINTHGQLDTTDFVIGVIGSGFIRDMWMQKEGKILLAGAFNQFGAYYQNANNIIRLKPFIPLATNEPKHILQNLQVQTLSQGIYKITLAQNSSPIEGNFSLPKGVKRINYATITDALGRTLQQIDLEKNNNSFDLDLNDYSQGIYFLNISGYKTVKLTR